VLGEHRGRYGLARAFRRKVRRMVPIGVPLAALLGLWPLGVVSILPRQSLHEAVKMELVAVVLLGAVLWLVVQWLRDRHRTIDVHERGLVDTRDGMSTRFAWDEIAAVFVKHTKLDNHGTIVETTRYRLEMSRGERLELTERVESIKKLGALIEREVGTRLEPRLRSQLDAGYPVTFGPLGLGREGLEHGTKKLAWADYDGALIRNGVVRLRRRGARWSWARVRYAVLPNAKILLAILARRAKTPPRR
jgi:hypothetical protein